MPQQTVSQALAVWREGERLLEQLPPLSPDHETVALAVAAARDVYVVLSRDAQVSAAVLEHSRETIAAARLVIEAAQARRGPDAAS